MRATYFFLVTGIMALNYGCGSSTEEKKLTEWQGAQAHIQLLGFINNEKVDVAMESQDATNTDLLYCKRKYLVTDLNDPATWSAGHLTQVKIVAIFDNYLGSNRKIDISFKNHNYQDDTLGTTVSVVAETDTAPQPTETNLEYQVNDDQDNSLYEESAINGQVRLARYTGTKGADGLVIPSGDGEVGLYFNATWNTTEKLSASITAKCLESEVEAD